MFTVVQLPLTDVRPFLDVETGRVKTPAWPIAYLPDDPYKAPFVRGFGRAHKRLRGGLDEWPAEDAYCDVSKAIRFARQVMAGNPLRDTGRVRAYCAFRRLYWDGQLQQAGAVAGRAEIGFGLRRLEEQAPLSAAECANVLDSLLSQRVMVRTSAKKTDPATRPRTRLLGESGSAFARAYLRASTKNEFTSAVKDWWVVEGTPLTIVEHAGPDDIEALPAGTTPVPLSFQELNGLRVFMGKRFVNNRERPVWFLEGPDTGAARDARRRLRINLTRLHSTLASLRALSDLQNRGRLAPTTDAARRNLQDCLKGYLPFLYQESYQGFKWTGFLRAALTLSEALTPGEFATLRALHPDPGRGLRAQFDLGASALAAHQPASPPKLVWDAFLAHDGRDKPVASQMYDLLGQRAQGKKVFFDAVSIPDGVPWDLAIPQAQEGSRMTLVLVGDTVDSAYYLRSEIHTAIGLARLDQERHRVVPVFLTANARQKPPYGLNLPNGIDASGANGLPEAADRVAVLLRDAPHPLNRLVSKPRS